MSGTDKATNFNFCTHILSIHRNKSPLQISGKVVGCVVRTLKTFHGTHILGASRGLLCDSSAVLLVDLREADRLSNYFELTLCYNFSKTDIDTLMHSSVGTKRILFLKRPCPYFNVRYFGVRFVHESDRPTVRCHLSWSY